MCHIASVAAALSRSKSTPGLVESDGKTPIVCIRNTYHNTLPPALHRNVLPVTNENATNETDRGSTCFDVPTTRPSGGMSRSNEVITLGESTDLVNSATASSGGSCADLYAQEPVRPVAGGHSPSHSICPPVYSQSSPVARLAPVYATTSGGAAVAGESFQPHMQGVGLPTNMMLPPGTPILQTIPPVGSYCALPHCNSAAAFPMSPYGNVFTPSFIAATPEQSPSSRSLPPVTFSVDPPTPLMPHVATSNSFFPQARDPASDVLLQEITRLRDRLHSMESENAAMTQKLNHQQWQVDHRLSEIEMQICGSDSAGSGSDERSGVVPNKESVI